MLRSTINNHQQPSTTINNHQQPAIEPKAANTRRTGMAANSA
jgi:hypothetical protein